MVQKKGAGHPIQSPKKKVYRELRAGNAVVHSQIIFFKKQTHAQKLLVREYLSLVRRSLRKYPKSVTKGIYLGAPLQFPSWATAIQGKIAPMEYWRIEFVLNKHGYWKVNRLILISGLN
jgi:hypothetical protein